MLSSSSGKPEVGQTTSSQPLVVVIAGSTGVGKSDVAARLCASKRGIIISADSVQAYKGVHIGANKPSLEERKETPHVLIDVVDHQTENYNAADWRLDALHVIQSLTRHRVPEDRIEIPEIRLREINRSMDHARAEKGYSPDEAILPVVTGGTMMYLQWLVNGRPDAPTPSATALQKAQKTIAGYKSKDDWEGALRYTSSLGTPFASRIEKLCGRDWYRLRRTLEVAYSVLEQKDESLIDKLYSGQREGGLESLDYDVRCFFLCPDDRMQHTRVVDRRCEEMVIRGLLKETADLKVSGTLPTMASKAIGYRQSLDYLEREDPKNDDENAFEAFLHDFTTATRRYAKRQMQWFRRERNFVFVPVSVSEEKAARVEKTFNTLMRLCEMTREEFEKECCDESCMSVETKKANESQGKAMKFYQPERHILKKGSTEWREALAQADECTNRLQAKKRRLDDSNKEML